MAEAKKAPEKKNWMTELLKDHHGKAASDGVDYGRVILNMPSLNWLLGGGLRRGYTTCFYGPEGGGKSLLTMLGTGEIQKADPEAIVVLITSEMREPDPERLKVLGVDPKRLFVRSVNTLHDIFDWIACPDSTFENSDKTKGPPGLLYMLKEGAPVQGLIIDSIKAIRGPKEQKSETSEDHIMGDMSFFLNPALRKILPVIREHRIATMFVQQVNMNMNPDEVKYQGKKWTIPSGQSLKHFCETMCLVERIERKESKLFSEDMTGMRDKTQLQVGHAIRVKSEKANLDKPFREAEFCIDYTYGLVNQGLEVATLAKAMGVIHHPVVPDIDEKTKLQKVHKETGLPLTKEIINQWMLSDAKKWIGWDKCVEALEAAPELRREVMAAVYALERS